MVWRDEQYVHTMEDWHDLKLILDTQVLQSSHVHVYANRSVVQLIPSQRKGIYSRGVILNNYCLYDTQAFQSRGWLRHLHGAMIASATIH